MTSSRQTEPHLCPTSTSSAASSNPFATRWIQPGALGFVFPVGESLSQLIERLVANHWCGQIVGPHGSGKSTLLSVLLPACCDAGKDVQRFQLQAGQKTLPVGEEVVAQWNHSTLVVVDGYEQLSWWQRWRLRRDCRQRGAGLLVTSHRSIGLPPLVKVSTSQSLLRHLVALLLARHPAGGEVPDVQICAAFDRHRGNLREALLELYDVYQRQQ